VAGKEALVRANRSKNDEFYTQLRDIEAELRHYRDQFKGKVVFCNCDDPYESNFFKFFAMNFNYLGLKKLITTCYTGSPITGTQLSLLDVKGLGQDPAEPRPAYKLEICEVPDANGDGAIDLSDVEYLLKNERNVLMLLAGDGDFRSAESVALLAQSDIVVTNPPFSLFREYLAQLVNHNKQFIVIGSKNAITYTEIFRLIMENRLWLGHGFSNGNAFFRVPDSYRDRFVEGVFNEETGLVKFRNVGWFTNMDTTNRHEKITLYRRYDPDDYPRYDNYDAIEVAKVADIPFDYTGNMGVPITFLDRYNPAQFEILGWTRGSNEFEAWPTKRYANARQMKPDGTESNGGKVNTGPTLLKTQRPANGTVYVADGVDGYLVQTYMRIIIRNRVPEKALT